MSRYLHLWLASLASLLLVLLLPGVSSAQAKAEEPWRLFDPARRIYIEQPIDGVPFVALQEKIAFLERGRSWRYYVIVVRDTPQLLEELATDLRTRWSARPEFSTHESFFVVVALDRPEVAVQPPQRMRDRLELTPARLRQLVPKLTGLTGLKPKERLERASLDGLSVTLASILDGVEKRLDAREAERRSRRLKSLNRYQELATTLAGERPKISLRLSELELSCMSMSRRGFDVRGPVDRLAQARALLASALDTINFAPDRAHADMERVRALLTRITATLRRLRTARNALVPKTQLVEQGIAELEAELKGGQVSQRATDQVLSLIGSARSAITRAKKLDAGGRPDQAETLLDQARADVGTAATKLKTPPPTTQPEPSAGIGRALGFVFGSLLGLIALTAAGGWLILRLLTAQARVLEEDLQGATARMAESLKKELDSLRRVYLTAKKPVGVEVPERLLPNSPPAALRYRGLTGKRLAEAEGLLNSLHIEWRGLNRALLLSEGTQTQAVWWNPYEQLKALQRSIRLLDSVSLRNLPVTRIRDCAQRLKKLSRASTTCAELLVESTRLIDESERRLEEALQAGQSTHSLDDAYAELVTKTLEASFTASFDPLGAARLVEEAREATHRLQAQISRTLEIVQGRDQALGRLEQLGQELGVPPTTPTAERDLPALVSWSYHLTDQVAQALDRGGREQATRELTQAVALIDDAERLSKASSGNLTQADLPSLREELHKAHASLQEMQAEFAPESWNDLEGALHRAAARIELLDHAGNNGHLPRLQTRINTIRRALFTTTRRLLQLHGERERVQGLIEELRARAEAIRNFLEREADAIDDVTKQVFADTKAQLERLAAQAHDEDEAPVWSQLLIRLLVTEQDLDALRRRAGQRIQISRRAWVLKRSLERQIRDDDDLLRRLGARPGARERLEAAREALLLGVQQLEGGEPQRALTLLQQGVQIAYEARDIAEHRGTRDLVPDRGALGDAQFAIVLAGQWLGRAHRLYLVGLGADPTEGWEKLAQARAIVADDPPRALALSEEALRISNEAILTANQKLDRLEDEEFEARRREGEQRFEMRLRAQDWIRQAELHRQARFEILGLGEEADFDPAEEEDLDRYEEEESELDALDDLTADTSDEAPIEEEPDAADSDSEPLIDSKNDTVVDSKSDEAEDAEPEAGEPETTEPETTEPETTEPETAETAEPETPESETAETAEPETPETAESETAEPETAEPETPEPETAETTEAETTKAETAEPETAEPETPETEITGSASAEDPEPVEASDGSQKPD